MLTNECNKCNILILLYKRKIDLFLNHCKGAVVFLFVIFDRIINKKFLYDLLLNHNFNIYYNKVEILKKL